MDFILTWLVLGSFKIILNSCLSFKRWGVTGVITRPLKGPQKGKCRREREQFFHFKSWPCVTSGSEKILGKYQLYMAPNTFRIICTGVYKIFLRSIVKNCFEQVKPEGLGEDNPFFSFVEWHSESLTKEIDYWHSTLLQTKG